ncbi:MAG: hypothetical protein LBG08_00030 [Spirochaetaceae bacterium]|nr:hypothetical protein [Spirochaetaceae bacterium]
MDALHLRFTPTGYAVIFPQDDLDHTVDALLDVNYAEDFCLATDFEPTFIADLMAAGFLVMSTEVTEEPSARRRMRNPSISCFPSSILSDRCFFLRISM